ncbi:carbamate kinase, partial [Streptomyces sp. P17]|nr:carbamate kinase [Streptomyces sp. P17]
MKPTIVVALGGNALLRRGQNPSYESQLSSVALAAESIAKLSEKYRVAIVHGNGPQVGLLSQQNEAYQEFVPAYPLSCLVAQTQGMIATMLVQELRKRTDKNIVSILSHVEVDANSPEFNDPTK